MALLGAHVVFAGSGSLATVEFRVVDAFGQRLSFSVQSFKGISGGQDFAPSFVVLRAEGIPYGQYCYRLTRNGAPAAAAAIGEMTASAPQVLKAILKEGTIVFAGDRLASITRRIDHAPIKGQLLPAPAAELAPWIRLQAVFQPYHLDIPVSETGQFAINESLFGTFILMVFGGDDLLHCSRLSLDH